MSVIHFNKASVTRVEVPAQAIPDEFKSKINLCKRKSLGSCVMIV